MIPLVLLPGVMCDREVWDQQIAALSDIADAVVMEWNRGHESIDAMAEATLAIAPPRFALAGHSMGGRVAFAIHRRAADRVTHLALMNTDATPLAPGEPGAIEERRRLRLLAIARTEGIRAMATEWLKDMLPPYRIDDQELRERIIHMFERKGAEVLAAQTTALLRRPDARPVVAQILCPTLVLTGLDDRWSPPARHQVMAAAIARSTLVLVPNSGHMSTIEQPAAVSSAMRDWLESGS